MSTIPSQEATAAVHDAISRALDEAGITNEVLRGMCIEVGLEKFNDSFRPPTPAADQQTERKDFEAWVKGDPLIYGIQGSAAQASSLDRDRDDDYANHYVHNAWVGWCARGACFAGGSPARDVEATAAIKEGWKLVPIEPTPAMIEAICAGQTSNATWPDDFNSGVQALRRAYAANSWAGGLAAAPTGADT